MVQMFSKCLICDSGSLVDLVGYEKDYLVRCKNCSFVFSKAVATYEDLQTEYLSTYTRSDDISPITLSRYPGLLDHFEKYRANNNIIDVGAGNGHFIKAAKDRGWNVFGTEFDERAVKICEDKGIIMHSGKLDVNNYKPGFFDVITSFEVIEHINNPQEEIASFNKILRVGGVTYITTPNVNSISRYFLKGKWTVFNYPEHLSYYSPGTLNRVFTQSGFKNVSLNTTGINYDRFVKSLQVKSRIVNSYNTETIRENSERKMLWKFAKKFINLLLNLTRKGDKIKAEFVKIKSL